MASFLNLTGFGGVDRALTMLRLFGLGIRLLARCHRLTE